MKKIIIPALWVVAFECVSFLIGMATQGDVNAWYKQLAHPPLTPPDWVFPVAWGTLYALIALAGAVLWNNRRAPGGKILLGLFAAYMILNWSWSFVFFGLHAVAAALIWIALMNILSLSILLRARHHARAATLLMIPPTLWTIFAMYLNAGVLVLN
jgi:tryptophan-rich sensory protein